MPHNTVDALTLIDAIQLPVDPLLVRLEKLTTKLTADVKKFAVSKLAQILYDCVETRVNPRDALDWTTSKTFIEKMGGDDWTKYLTKHYLFLRVYDLLREDNLDIEPIGRNVLCNFSEKIDDYRRIASCLKAVPLERQAALLEQAAMPDREKMNLFLGRLVWDEAYQRIKSHLPEEYERIRFH